MSQKCNYARNQRRFDLSNFRKQQKVRSCLPGYPSTEYFQTPEEINEYFSGDKITCLHCGGKYKILTVHLIKSHGITEDEYKKRYGLPYTRGLISENIRKNISSIQKKLFSEGINPLSNKNIRLQGVAASKKSLALKGARTQPFIGTIRSRRNTDGWKNVITQQQYETIISYVKSGISIKESCKKVGCSPSGYYGLKRKIKYGIDTKNVVSMSRSEIVKKANQAMLKKYYNK